MANSSAKALPQIEDDDDDEDDEDDDDDDDEDEVVPPKQQPLAGKVGQSLQQTIA